MKYSFGSSTRSTLAGFAASHIAATLYFDALMSPALVSKISETGHYLNYPSILLNTSESR